MQISILCSDPDHPVLNPLRSWIEKNSQQHTISLVHQTSDLCGGEILFLVSCSEHIPASLRKQYKMTLVLHASDLPKGRGWSPHVWAVLNGAEQITLTLLEAAEGIDCGDILAQTTFEIPKHALWDEINHSLFCAEIKLIDRAVNQLSTLNLQPQSSETEPSYYPKRTPEDSRIDPELSIASQFDQIRVCDPNRYPAFFELHGKRYKLTLEKLDD